MDLQELKQILKDQLAHLLELVSNVEKAECEPVAVLLVNWRRL